MFAGLISKEQPISAWGDPDKILDALAPYSLDKPRDVWSTDRQLLVQVATRTGSTTAVIYQHLESGVAVAFWGRLDNRPDLIAQLDAENKASDDELIALAWLKWGEFCPEKLIGDFAFAVASPKTGAVFLARDVMGVKPLFYRADAHGVFFANSAAAFKPLKLGTLTPSQEWMARYLAVLSFSRMETAYVEIKKLPGAHSLLAKLDGSIILRRYHRFVDDAPIEKNRDPKYLEAYRAVWQEAVACRIPNVGPIGCENSGGLDSGSITAEIANQLGGDIDRLHGMGFANESLEPALIMATAMKHKMANNFLSSSSFRNSDQDMQKMECLVVGYPVEHFSAMANIQLYKICQQQGINILNSGFGGDEVVTNEGVPLRAELLQQRNWQGLWQILPGYLPSKFGRLLKTVMHGVNQPDIALQIFKEWNQMSNWLFLREQAVNSYGLKAAFFEMTDAGTHYRQVNTFALSQIERSFVSTRFENCTLMASSFGIEYVWPLWDQRLVQQWLSTPAIWKVGPGGVGRYLHRRAVNGVCADAVAWKQSKGMGGTELKAVQDKCSIVPELENLLGAINQLPNALVPLVDMQKLRDILTTGINKKWLSGDVEPIFELHMASIENIGFWLKRECS